MKSLRARIEALEGRFDAKLPTFVIVEQRQGEPPEDFAARVRATEAALAPGGSVFSICEAKHP